MFASFNRPDWRGGAANTGNDMRQFVLLGALLLSACGQSEEARRTERGADRIEAAKELVRAGLRDPASALFSDVRLSQLSAVCGSVNSRNGFGGMTGPKRFIVIQSVYLEENFTADPGMFPRMWQESCEMSQQEFMNALDART